MVKKKSSSKSVATLTHDDAKRKNIPTAEYQTVLQKNEHNPVRVAYECPLVSLTDEKNRRTRDLDLQLVWRGKDEQDWSDLVVHAPPHYIQEKVHPKVLIDDLLSQSNEHPSPSRRLRHGTSRLAPGACGPKARGEGDQRLFSDIDALDACVLNYDSNSSEFNKLDYVPGLKIDFILASPPFNVSVWSGERLREDKRWTFGVPLAWNANFAWIQHKIQHFAPAGFAGFVLANGSISSNQSGEGEIRNCGFTALRFETKQVPVSNHTRSRPRTKRVGAPDPASRAARPAGPGNGIMAY